MVGTSYEKHLRVIYMSSNQYTGQTLRTVLDDLESRGERLPQERVRDIITYVCAALSSLHNTGEVHGAVHPANIRLESGNAVLFDSAPASTSAYISPEQAAGFPPDSRSDIYALGIILFEMLAGTPPFTADTDLALTLHHLNTPIPSLAQHLEKPDPALESLVNKALAKNADDRFQTGQQLTQAVSEAFGGAPPQPVLPTLRQNDPLPEQSSYATAQPESKPAGNRRTLLIGTALVVAVILFTVYNESGEPVVSAFATPTPTTQAVGINFLSSFTLDDPTNAAWPQTDSGSVARVITPDGFYHFQSEIAASAITSIYGNDLHFTDAIITLDGRLDENSPAASGYGIVFRYVDDRNYNVFAVDGAGRFSIWELRRGSWTELRGADENWTPDSAVNQRGINNTLSIAFTGGHFIGSVNDQVVADVTVDDPVLSGSVGIYLATTRSGQADIFIDTYRVSSTP
jgi:serine/threonine protein kinase